MVGVEAAATTILPPLAGVALDFELGGAVFLGLNFGEWRDGSLRYEPGHPMGLARSWDIEGRRLTYHLDTGRRWSDGVPIRAEDVRFTFELLADTTLALPLSSVTAHIDSVAAPDDSTAVFYFRDRYPGMLFDTGVGVLPVHFFGEVPRERFTGGLPLPDGGTAADVPASGPFTLGDWSPAESVTLLRNSAAARPARLARLVVRVIPDETTRAAELRSGSLNAARFNSFRIARGLDSAGFALHAIPQRGYDYIAWNPLAVEALADRSVRQALSLGIDRDALMGALDLDGFAEAAWGPYGSLFSDLRSPPPHVPLFDPQTAARLLDDAGWLDGDGDGVRERGSHTLAFELSVPTGNDRREDAAEIIQAQLAELGVEVTIRPTEFNALFGRLLAGDYQAALMGWQVALDPDISVFWTDLNSPLNIASFDRPSVSEAIEAALAQDEAAAARPYWRLAGADIAKGYPYAFLWYFDFPLVVDVSVKGVRVDASGWGPGLGDWELRP